MTFFPSKVKMSQKFTQKKLLIGELCLKVANLKVLKPSFERNVQYKNKNNNVQTSILMSSRISEQNSILRFWARMEEG